MTADLIALKRLNDFLTAMEKMHNGLLAMIEAHQEFKAETDKRLDKLEARLEELKDRLPE